MKFSYIAISKEGQESKEFIEAESLEAAQILLHKRDQWYKKLRPSHNRSWSLVRSKHIGYKRLSILSRNISIYLKSGIPLLTAINLSKNQIEDKNIKEFLSEISYSLEEGKSLYMSLEIQKVFYLPDFYTYSLQVAEKSGTLQLVFEELAKYLSNLDTISNRIKHAMVYPLFIMALAILMVSFMLSIVVPKITQVFEGLNQDLPGITAFVINLGEFFREYSLILLILLIVIILVLRYIYMRFESIQLFVDKTILSIPIINKVRITWELARFSYIVSILVHSGVTFIHAVKLATNTLGNLYIKKQFQAATQNVVEGSSLSHSLKNQGFKLDDSFLQAIAIGEETSEIHSILKNLSELYIQENNERIGVFMALLEPLLILFVGLIIGFIVTAMLLPIFSVNFAIQ